MKSIGNRTTALIKLLYHAKCKVLLPTISRHRLMITVDDAVVMVVDRSPNMRPRESVKAGR